MRRSKGGRPSRILSQHTLGLRRARPFAHHHLRVPEPLGADEREQRRGVPGREPDAAVGGSPSEATRFPAAVNGVAARGEEDRVRHRGVIPLSRRNGRKAPDGVSNPARPVETGQEWSCRPSNETDIRWLLLSTLMRTLALADPTGPSASTTKRKAPIKLRNGMLDSSHAYTAI